MKACLTIIFIPFLACAQIELGGNVEVGGSAVLSLQPWTFDYSSVVFDNTDAKVTRSSPLLNVSDTKTGIVSFWVKMRDGSSDSTAYRIMENVAFPSMYIYRSSGGAIDVDIRYSGMAGLVNIFGTDGAVVKASGWVHILIAWNVNSGGVAYIYADDVDVTQSVADVSDSIREWTNAGNYSIGGYYGSTSSFPYMLTEFYLSTGYLDISQESNRRKFISADLKPVYLGESGELPTGTQPAIYLHNAPPNWEVNLGSGGNFTEVGTIADGGTDKP